MFIKEDSLEFRIAYLSERSEEEKRIATDAMGKIFASKEIPKIDMGGGMEMANLYWRKE